MGVLLLLVLLGVKSTTRTIWNPSLTVYRSLHTSHGDSLKCACSKTVISHDELSSPSATLHQVCSSDFIDEKWIATLSRLDLIISGAEVYGWYGLRARHFRLLSSLCEFANRTVSDAVLRFGKQSLITLNVIAEADFVAQLNIIFNQLKESLTTDFDLLLTLVQLITQVDQPYTIGNNAKLILSLVPNATNSEPDVEVGAHFSHN